MILPPNPTIATLAEVQRAAQAERAATAAEPTALESVDILQGGKLALIRHNDLVYRLQVTRAGKLILTK